MLVCEKVRAPVDLNLPMVVPYESTEHAVYEKQKNCNY